MRFNPRFLDVDGLEEAYARLDELKPSEQGRAIMAPKMVFRVVRVDNLDTKAANILKQNMLSIGGEVSHSRPRTARAPRENRRRCERPLPSRGARFPNRNSRLASPGSNLDRCIPVAMTVKENRVPLNTAFEASPHTGAL